MLCLAGLAVGTPICVTAFLIRRVYECRHSIRRGKWRVICNLCDKLGAHLLG